MLTVYGKKNNKKVARTLGFEIQRYTPQTSDLARIQALFSYHNIDLVLDVGANAGQYAKLLRECGYSGRIVSFEPLSTAYTQLKATSRNDPMWDVAPRTALGNKDGEIAINVSGNSESSSVLDMLDSHLESASDSAYIGSEKVKLCRLDQIVKEYLNNDTTSIFLKIDVQGFERQVLEGATQILPRVHGIQLEMSLIPLYKNQPLYQEIIEIMKELGYELHAVLPGFTDFKSGRLLQMDGIFFRK